MESMRSMYQYRANPKQSIVATAVVILVIVGGAYLLWSRREPFSWTWSTSRPATQNSGSMRGSVPVGVGYQKVNDLGVNFEYDNSLPNSFPVSSDNSGVQPISQYMPASGASTTMYDKDITDPNTYMFRPAARVQLKGRQFVTSNKFVGDIPIAPGQPSPWARTQSNYDATDGYNNHAYFSAFGQQRYAMLSNPNSRVGNVSNQELIMS